MKKVITILAVMIVLVGAVFAADVTKTLTINTEVTAVKPAFTLYGNTSNATSGRVQANTSITAATDGLLGSSGITLYCWIAQTADCIWVGHVDISVAATAFTNTTTVGTYAAGSFSSTAPVISNITAMNPKTSSREGATTGDTRLSTPDDTNHSVRVAYGTGLKAVAEDVASFSVNWPQSDVPPATYQATITTTYTAP